MANNRVQWNVEMVRKKKRLAGIRTYWLNKYELHFHFYESSENQGWVKTFDHISEETNNIFRLDFSKTVDSLWGRNNLKLSKKDKFEANMTIGTLEYEVVESNSTLDRVDSV